MKFQHLHFRAKSKMRDFRCWHYQSFCFRMLQICLFSIKLDKELQSSALKIQGDSSYKRNKNSTISMVIDWIWTQQCHFYNLLTTEMPCVGVKWQLKNETFQWKSHTLFKLLNFYLFCSSLIPHHMGQKSLIEATGLEDPTFY